MGCGSAKVLRNGTESSSTHHRHPPDSRRSKSTRRCKTRLFGGYSSPSRTSGCRPDSLAKLRGQPRGKTKTPTIGRSTSRENPYHEVRLQHNKVRPSVGVYECSSARQYPDENFRVRTSVSGTSRIRVTLSSDGSMLEIETEKLATSDERRDPTGRRASEDSDGYVRLSPRATVSGRCGSSQITHAQVECFDDSGAGCSRPIRDADDDDDGRRRFCCRSDDVKGNYQRIEDRDRENRAHRYGMDPEIDADVSEWSDGCQQNGCHKCVGRPCNPRFIDQKRAIRRNSAALGPSSGSSSTNNYISASTSTSSDRRGWSTSVRDDDPSLDVVVPFICHDEDDETIRAKRNRGGNGIRAEPTPVSSPMSPSFMGSFDYECALRGMSTEPIPTAAEDDPGRSPNEIVSATSPPLIAEGRFPREASEISSRDRHPLVLDPASCGHSGQTPFSISRPRPDDAPTGTRDHWIGHVRGEASAADTDRTAQQPCRHTDECAVRADSPRSSTRHQTGILTNRRCSSIAEPVDGNMDNGYDVEKSSECTRNQLNSRSTKEHGRHSTDAQSTTNKPTSDCGITGNGRTSRCAVSNITDDDRTRSMGPSTTNCVNNNNVKKKRTKFWLRKVNSENDKEGRKVTNFGHCNGGGIGHRSSQKNARRLPGNKCLSFDSATMLESRASRDSPSSRKMKPTKPAFVHPVSGAARSGADVGRSLSGECSASSEAGSSSSSNPNHAQTPRCSVHRSDSSGSVLSSDLSSSSRRSSRKNRVIGQNTKQQIVEVGLMVSNPLEHQVTYSIANDLDTVDTLDAVDEGLELDSDTSDNRDHIESKLVLERDGTPTEDIIVEEQIEQEIHITPATTNINKPTVIVSHPVLMVVTRPVFVLTSRSVLADMSHPVFVVVSHPVLAVASHPVSMVVTHLAFVTVSHPVLAIAIRSVFVPVTHSLIAIVTHPMLVIETQTHPVTRQPCHIDRDLSTLGDSRDRR
ncbi:hypothetical protein LSH36_322g04024 [Paralvinella palmiformis]|uniref:Uncharacterized protein n=1 Tax=Paralvinella palmiformis TaxID=53620 RepID=A0AAD9JGE9_9ANNE|nr:hypothetical protein LSH36_322g04024 [Paralvinella palmiformis]